LLSLDSARSRFFELRRAPALAERRGATLIAAAPAPAEAEAVFAPAKPRGRWIATEHGSIANSTDNV
jgi:hypothetical protein